MIIIGFLRRPGYGVLSSSAMLLSLAFHYICLHINARNGPLTKPGSDCSDRIGSDSGSDRIGFRIGLVSSLLVQKNYFDKSCFNNDTGGSDIFI